MIPLVSFPRKRESSLRLLFLGNLLLDARFRGHDNNFAPPEGKGFPPSLEGTVKKLKKLLILLVMDQGDGDRVFLWRQFKKGVAFNEDLVKKLRR